MASESISPDFPFTKKHISVLDSQMAYVDTGAPNPETPTVLMLHGNPTSSYLYRNIIPHLSPVARCIAPDLMGCGDSDKMPSNGYYIREHIAYFAAFMDAVIPASNPSKLFLMIHDWGSAIGFDWSRKNSERVSGLIFMEWVIPSISLLDFDPSKREMFEKFRTEGVGRELIIDQNVFIEIILGKAGTARGLTEVEMEHYRRPFLNPKDREPMYRFPNEIPFGGHPANVAEIVDKYWEWLRNNEVPKLMFWGEPGAVVSPEKAEELVGMMKNVRSVGLGKGRHFLQEDNPQLIGEESRKFVEEVVKV